MTDGPAKFAVEKENYTLPVWSHRTLTVTPRAGKDDLHIAGVSKKHHPEELDHHQIIAHEVNLWPHYHGEYRDRAIAGEGEVAKLVIGISGVFYNAHSKVPAELQTKHTYWKIRFQDFATLKAAVLALRGTDENSPVPMKGTLEDLDKEIHMKTHSVIDDAAGNAY